MKNLYLVDASNMFFRAFFAIPPLSSPTGMPTNALYGFLAMSLKLMREVRPEYLVYCFDRKEPSFREALYPEYKANRDEMPDNLAPQIPYLKKLTEKLGIPVWEAEGFEADDVIGTLAMMGVQNRVNCVIVSGDKDFAQLVRPGVSLYDTMKDVRTDTDGVKAKFGIRPDQMIDYLAMVGDASDNVPGVRGIGPKGAQKLLLDYESLDGVYDKIGEIKGATQKKMIEGKDSAFLSRKLCTIRLDVPLKLEFADLKLRPFDKEPLRELLLELGFGSFERKLFAESAAAPASASAKDSQSTSGAEVNGASGKSKKKTKAEDGNAADADFDANGDAENADGGAAGSGAAGSASDSKTAAAKPKRAGKKSAPAFWTEETWTLEQLSRQVPPYAEIWALLGDRGLYFGIDGTVARVDAEDKAIGEILAPKNLRWKGYDLKQVLKSLGVEGALVIWDGMLAAYVARANAIPPFAQIYEQHCDKKLPDLATAPDEVLAHQELEVILRQKMIEQEGLSVFETIDIPLVPVLVSMELKGVRLDMDELKNQGAELGADVKRLEQEIFAAAGENFNIGSPKQLGHVLFEKLKLPVGRKTKTGYSTDSDVLDGLADKHPVAKLIVEYRELSKLKSTYVDALPTLADEEERVHTSLNQAATSTGRLSSTNPNLQNIPIRTERGRRVRKAFIARPGQVLISADYSQIELRILAHITGDEGLTRAFMEDLDIHAATAAEVFNIDLAAVTPNHRRIAKAVNFGLAYGQGAFGLADVLGIPRGEATEIIQRYFTRFAGVKRYMEQTVREGIDNGYVSTLFGRRRYIDELRSKNPMQRRSGERAAINAPIQGTASDLVKLAMMRVYENLPVPLLLQVHDELLFECAIDEAEEMCAEIKTIMESVHQLRVPLKVNVGVGPNWDDAH